MHRAFRASVGFFVAFLLVLTGCQSGQPKEPLAFEVDPSRVSHVDIEPDRWSIELIDADQHFKTQETDQLCWAAAVQTVRSIERRKYPTQDELRRAHVLDLPGEYREAAHHHEIVDALAGGYAPQFAGRFVVEPASPPVVSQKRLIRQLSRGEPAILVLRRDRELLSQSHAYVLYGVEYVEGEPEESETNEKEKDDGFDPMDILRAGGKAVEGTKDFITGGKDPHAGRHYRIVKAKLWDPMPESGGRKEAGSELLKTDTLLAMTTTTARERLDDALKWANKNTELPGIYVRAPLRNKPVGYVEFDLGDRAATQLLIYGIYKSQDQ